MKKILLTLLTLLGVTLAVYALNKKIIPTPKPPIKTTKSDIKKPCNDSKKKEKPDPITPFNK